MKVTVVGCSGSFSGPASPASSYLVTHEADGRTWRVLLDLGPGALGALHRHIHPSDLDAVVLTHLHPDHCLDMCGLYVARCYDPQRPATAKLPVHAPAGASDRLARAYGVDEPEDIGAQFDFHDIADGSVVQIGPLTITCRLVNHPVEAYGLRVEVDGAVLAYTGDTDTCDALGDLMADAGVVLADSAFVEGRDTVKGIHLSGRRAALAAQAAGGVQRLLLTHIPVWNDPQVCLGEARDAWDGSVELAEPGATYAL